MGDSFFKVCFLAGLIVYLSVVEAPHKWRTRRNRTSDRRDTALHVLLMILDWMGMQALPVLCVLTPWLDFADYHLPTWAGGAGVAAFAFALWLLWRSHADLGRNWSASLRVVDEQSLITQGVYHHIRHPIYAALWLWGVAQALLVQNWIGGLSHLVFFLPLYLYRVQHEERMMLEHFGEAYRLYMHRTARIIPRLRR